MAYDFYINLDALGHFFTFLNLPRANLQYSSENQHVPENQWLEDVLPTEIVPF